MLNEVERMEAIRLLTEAIMTYSKTSPLTHIREVNEWAIALVDITNPIRVAKNFNVRIETYMNDNDVNRKIGLAMNALNRYHKEG